MKRFLATLSLIMPLSLAAHAEQLIPAGSVVQCMVSDKVSSKTMHVGDPVLCQLNRTEMYGRSVLPYGAYLEGRFEEYKDPGHFVGKGWMELKFDRMVVGNDTTIPISTRVIATSAKNPVDSEGRIHGTGHPVRDTVEWLIPVLWPIDIINLPRRGPTPTLKPETRLTVKVLDDFGVPTKREVQHQPELVSRYNYADNEPEQQQAAPIERTYARPTQAERPYYPPPAQQAYAQPMQQGYAQQGYVQQAYAQPNPTVVVVQGQAPAQQAPIILQQPVAAPAIYQTPPAPAPVVYGYPPVFYPGYYRPY